MSKAILERVRKRRTHEVEVEPGKKVFFLRPPENDMASILDVDRDSGKATFKVSLEHVCKYVNGWDGFTEADLLGADIAPPDAVPFDEDLWRELVSDKIEWRNKIADAILSAVVKHVEAKGAVEKN